jgi:hypothetical protein
MKARILLLRPARLDEGEPVLRRVRLRAGEHLDLVAVLQLVPQRHHLAVHLGADALLADGRVHREGEVHRGGVSRQALTSPRGVKTKTSSVKRSTLTVSMNSFGSFRSCCHSSSCRSQAKLLVVARGDRRLALFVGPVRGDALFGHAVHLVGADLQSRCAPTAGR